MTAGIEGATKTFSCDQSAQPDQSGWDERCSGVTRVDHLEKA